MRYLVIVFFALYTSKVCGQVEYVNRMAIDIKPFERGFTVQPFEGGVVAFRTITEQGSSNKMKFEFVLADDSFQLTEYSYFDVPDFHKLGGYDVADGLLYLLFSRYGPDPRQVVYRLNLQTGVCIPFEIKSMLDFAPLEFSFLDGFGIFRGSIEDRPVVQIIDLEKDKAYTLAGIYANDAQIIQMQKDEQRKVLDVVVSATDPSLNKTVSVLTFEMDGGKQREVKISRLKNARMEILGAFLSPADYYTQGLIGPFGSKSRGVYQGVYFTNINEFGEHRNDYYTLADLPNFYNYLPERKKNRKDRAVQRAVAKDKTLKMPHSFATRDVFAMEDGYMVYNEHQEPVNSILRNTYAQAEAAHKNSLGLKYTNVSAQFMYVNHDGDLLWDNALPLAKNVVFGDNKFGHVSFDGKDLFYLYLVNERLYFNHIRDGEVISKNLAFPVAVKDESLYVRQTDLRSLSLEWWYDNYFLLSGKQRVKVNDGGTKDVFFITKVRVDGSQEQYAME